MDGGETVTVTVWSSDTLEGNMTLNTTTAPLHDPGLPDEYQYILIALYTTTTLLAVTGNVIVIGVLSVGRRSRTDLRAFLINLAIADLTMALFCMPFTFTFTMLHDWIFGAALCTIVLFVQVLTVTASVCTSTVIAVDRYLVFARPLKRRASRRARLASIWILAAALSSVQLAVGRTETFEASPGVRVTFCHEAWPEPGADVWHTSYTFFVLLTTYLLPLGATGPAYVCVARRLWKRRPPGNADTVRDLYQLKSKRRVIKMLMVVVTLFAVCWLPLHVFNILLDFVPQLRNEDQPEASSIVVAFYTAAHWLAMSNSFVNPIIYGFLNDSFRYDLCWLVTRCCRHSTRCPVPACTHPDDMEDPADHSAAAVYGDGPLLRRGAEAGGGDQAVVNRRAVRAQHRYRRGDVSPAGAATPINVERSPSSFATAACATSWWTRCRHHTTV